MDERVFSTVLAGFARTLLADFSAQALVDLLVVQAVDVLPVQGAGALIMGRDELGADEGLRWMSATDDVLRQVESLQAELGQGPCLQAYRTGDRVEIPDLAADEQFPAFSARARQAGMGAVYAFPLRLDGHRLGALDVYAEFPLRLDGRELAAGQTLADVAAAYLFNAHARAEESGRTADLEQKLLHDPLTGLPNRTLLLDRLAAALSATRRERHQVAVLFLDVDGFKQLNDVYGHAAGDLLLVAFAARLQQALRPGDTLARLAGDEFVVLCPGLQRPAQAADVADRLLQALHPAVVLAGLQVDLSASIGIALHDPVSADPDHRTGALALLAAADAAMYQAKNAGGARHAGGF